MLSPGVLEVVSDHRADTFRSVYAVRFADRVFVLHAFQKKSKSGIATPKADIELIKQRLKQAVEISKKREGKKTYGAKVVANSVPDTQPAIESLRIHLSSAIESCRGRGRKASRVRSPPVVVRCCPRLRG